MISLTTTPNMSCQIRKSISNIYLAHVQDRNDSKIATKWNDSVVTIFRFRIFSSLDLYLLSQRNNFGLHFRKFRLKILTWNFMNFTQFFACKHMPNRLNWNECIFPLLAKSLCFFCQAHSYLLTIWILLNRKTYAYHITPYFIPTMERNDIALLKFVEIAYNNRKNKLILGAQFIHRIHFLSFGIIKKL